jgi:hypothetical protein
MQERAVLGEAIGVGFRIAEIDREIIARDHFANFLSIFQRQGHFRVSPLRMSEIALATWP